MKHIAKHILFISVIVVLGLVLLLVYKSINRSVYNEHPNVSHKLVGSKSLIVDRISVESLDQLVGWADLIIIGKVRTEGTVYKEAMVFPNNQLAEKAGSTIVFDLTKTQVDVEEVIYGTTSINTIQLVQLGIGDLDETKVKMDDRMLFILKRHEGKENLYSSVSCENGLFIINHDGTLLSLTDNLNIAKYDTVNLAILKRDLLTSIKNLGK